MRREMPGKTGVGIGGRCSLGRRQITTAAPPSELQDHLWGWTFVTPIK